MKNDKNSSNISNIGSSNANVAILSKTQVEKEENTNIEDIPASIPSIKVITDADRSAFLDDDGGY